MPTPSALPPVTARSSVSRRVLLAAAGAGGVVLAACGASSSGTRETARPPSTGPQEIVWSKQQIGQPQDGYWTDTWKIAAQATGVTITPAVEPGSDYWTKRQTEFASGTTSVDIMTNNTSWIIPGGLTGMFIDLSPLMRRDKVAPQIFYKADLDTWSWRGMLWAIPNQSGGEVVYYNKQLFQAKGVKLPTKDWTYDDLLQACQRLNDAANSKFALVVGQNGLHYMGGTFLLNFGGKILNDTRDRALYGDDPHAGEGAAYDVDLHTKYRLTPTEEARATLGQGQGPMEAQMVAMEINHLYRRAALQKELADNLDFAPPPKGPKGIQRAAVAGNAWTMLALSKAQDAAWKVLRWLYTTKEGQATPQIRAVSWPPVVATANSPAWLDQFQGTHIADCAGVWATGGHDILPLPEGAQAFSAMNDPFTKALMGQLGVREALQQSAAAVNELFSRRPAAWK